MISNEIYSIAIKAYNEAGKADGETAETFKEMGVARFAAEAFGAVAHHLGLCDDFEFVGLEHSTYGSIELDGELVEVRVADHANQSAMHGASPINIAPGADD